MQGICNNNYKWQVFKILFYIFGDGDKDMNIELVPLKSEDREQFILDNQEAFKYGAMEEFGLRDDHFEEDGEIFIFM